MIHILRLILTQMVLSLRSRAELQVENLALRHQIEILKRTAPKRARLTKTDRLIFTWLLRVWPKSAQLVRIVHPKTLVRWHREGFRVYWRWKSRRRGGRPRAPTEIRALIRQLSAQNPLWGAPRIHGELLKLGLDISQATVSRYMPRRPPNPEQTRKAFLRNHIHSTASIDFLVVPTLTFKILFVLVVPGAVDAAHDATVVRGYHLELSHNAEPCRQPAVGQGWISSPRRSFNSMFSR